MFKATYIEGQPTANPDFHFWHKRCSPSQLNVLKGIILKALPKLNKNLRERITPFVYDLIANAIERDRKNKLGVSNNCLNVVSNYVVLCVGGKFFTKEYKDANPIAGSLYSYYGLTSTLVDYAFDFLKKTNIMDIEVGSRKYLFDKETCSDETDEDQIILGNRLFTFSDKPTVLTIKPINEWNVFNFLSSMNEGVAFYTIFGAFRSKRSFDDYDIAREKLIKNKACIKNRKVSSDGEIIAFSARNDKFTKSKNRAIVEAPVEEQNILDAINSYYEDFDFLKYNRSFLDTTLSGGRFFSYHMLIPGSVMDRLCEKFKFRKIDFAAFGVNTLHLVEKGKRYEPKVDTYLDILHNIPIFNFLLQKGLIDESYLLLYRPMLKKILNSAFANNKVNNVTESFRRVLIDSGLYYGAPQYDADIDPRGYSKNGVMTFKLCDSLTPKLREYLIEHEFSISPETITIPIRPQEIIDAIKITFSDIIKYYATDCTGILQNVESRIAEKVMLSLVKEGEAPLSRHDCFYVREEIADRYERKMNLLQEEMAIKYRKEVEEAFEHKFDNFASCVTLLYHASQNGNKIVINQNSLSLVSSKHAFVNLYIETRMNDKIPPTFKEFTSKEKVGEIVKNKKEEVPWLNKSLLDGPVKKKRKKKVETFK